MQTIPFYYCSAFNLLNYSRITKLIASSFTLLSSAQTAEEIIRKADEKYRGKSSYSEMTINIVRPKWSKQMKIKSWSEGTKYSVSIVTSPAKEKGTVFLMRDKEVWNYMPTIDRTIKFPPSMMLQNWMGTDLTNDDLVKQSSILEDYTHKIIREELKEGYTCWVIELTPKEDAPVVWGKVLIWVDKNDFMMLQTDYYDEDDFLVNQMIGSEIKEFSGKKLPSKLRVIPSENKGQETILIYDKLEFDISISEQYFPYIRPQENGNRSDVRWLVMATDKKVGLKFSSNQLLNFSALHYSMSALDSGENKGQIHAAELTPSKKVYLNIDGFQSGLGGIDSWGALPLEKYRLPYQSYYYSYRITPIDL